MWGRIMKAKDFFEAFDCFFSDIDKISICVEHGWQSDDIEIPIELYFEIKRDAKWLNYRVSFWTVNKKVLDVILVEM